MSTRISQLVAPMVAPHIAAIRPYEPGKPIEEVERELGPALPPGGAIKLASNENPIGPSPRALEAIRTALEKIHLYPDGASFRLRHRLAAFHGVREDELAVGNGSNEIIDLLVRTFCQPGDELVAPAHTFLCYRLAAQVTAVAYREVPRAARFAYDPDALLAAVTPRTRMVFLCNPDNPTGVFAPRAAIERLLRRLPPRVIFVVDEAYFDYARSEDYPDCLALRDQRELLVVLRTFSKIHGLASLRCGYAVAPREIIDYFNRVRAPFNVNSLAQAAATAAIDDVQHIARARAVNTEGMAQMEDGLRRLGIDFVPSQANFMLVDVAPRSGRELFQAMLRLGVIVRPLDAYSLPRHLRVTIGTSDENRRFLDAFAQVLAA